MSFAEQQAANEQAAHYQKLIEKNPGDAVPFPKSREERLDDLLGLLRKHKVAEFEQDGIKLKFEHSSFLAQMIEQQAPESVRTEPGSPEIGAVEPDAHNIEDVLFGAK